MVRRFAIVVALMGACGSSPRQTSAPPTPPAPLAPTAPPAISEADATRFAADFLRAAAPCDIEKVAELYDHDRFTARLRERTSPAGRETLDAMEPLLAAGALQAMKTCAWLEPTEQVELLRVRSVDGEMRPLFRKRTLRSIAYIELSLVRAGDGVVRIADLHSLNMNEWISDELAATADVSVYAEDPAVAMAVNRVRLHQDAGRFVEALAVIDGFSPEIRRAKPMQNWRVEIASQISTDAHRQAIDERRALFPHVVPTSFQTMSDAFVRGDRTAALAAIDALDREVGGDPALEDFRAAARALSASP